MAGADWWYETPGNPAWWSEPTKDVPLFPIDEIPGIAAKTTSNQQKEPAMDAPSTYDDTATAFDDAPRDTAEMYEQMWEAAAARDRAAEDADTL